MSKFPKRLIASIVNFIFLVILDIVLPGKKVT